MARSPVCVWRSGRERDSFGSDATHDDGGRGLSFQKGDRGRMRRGTSTSTKTSRNRPTTNRNEQPL